MRLRILPRVCERLLATAEYQGAVTLRVASADRLQEVRPKVVGVERSCEEVALTMQAFVERRESNPEGAQRPFCIIQKPRDGSQNYAKNWLTCAKGCIKCSTL